MNVFPLKSYSVTKFNRINTLSSGDNWLDVSYSVTKFNRINTKTFGIKNDHLSYSVTKFNRINTFLEAD